MLDMLNSRYATVSQGVVFRYARAEHVRSAAGFVEGQRAADYVAMDLWPGIPHGSLLAFHGHEVKVSRADWLAELRKPEKAAAFMPFMDYWWLVVSDRSIVQDGELPPDWGLMVKAGDRVRVVVSAHRNPNPLPMPKTMVAAFARAVAKTAARIGVPCRDLAKPTTHHRHSSDRA